MVGLGECLPPGKPTHGGGDDRDDLSCWIGALGKSVAKGGGNDASVLIMALLALGRAEKAARERLATVQAGAQAPMQMQGDGRRGQFKTRERTQLEQLVANYLNSTQSQVGPNLSPAPGFSDHVAGMQPGTDDRWVVDLVGGTTYGIIGACDNECSNMDIELIDMNTGGVVASDVLPDDFPCCAVAPHGQRPLQ